MSVLKALQRFGPPALMEFQLMEYSGCSICRRIGSHEVRAAVQNSPACSGSSDDAHFDTTKGRANICKYSILTEVLCLTKRVNIVSMCLCEP